MACIVSHSQYSVRAIEGNKISQPLRGSRFERGASRVRIQDVSVVLPCFKFKLRNIFGM